MLRRLPPLHHRRRRGHDRANGVARLRLHDDFLAGDGRRVGEQQIVQQKRLRPPDGRELDRDEAELAMDMIYSAWGPTPTRCRRFRSGS